MNAEVPASPQKRKQQLLASVSFMSRAPLALLVATSDLPGLELMHFRYVPALDEFTATFSFEGYRLELWMDWESGVSLLADQSVPEQTFSLVAKHFSTHKVPWMRRIKRLREFERLYRTPAKATWYEKREETRVQ